MPKILQINIFNLPMTSMGRNRIWIPIHSPVIDIWEKYDVLFWPQFFILRQREFNLRIAFGGSMHFSNFCRDFPKWFKEHRSISEQNNFFYTHCISICKNLGQKSSICDPSKNTKIGKRAYVRVVIHTKPFCID